MALYENKADNYDDFLDKLNEEHTKTIDDAIEAIHKFDKKENKHHYIINQFKPAGDKLYNTFLDNLKSKFGDDVKASVHGEENEKKVKESLFEALKDYLKVARPEVVESIDEMDLPMEDALDHLIGAYDSMHGVNPQDPFSQGRQGGPTTIRSLLGVAKDPKGTLGDLVQSLLARQAQDPAHAMNHLQSKYNSYHLSKFDKHKLMRHAYHKVKDSDYDIFDKVRFVQQDSGDYASLIKAFNYKDFEGIKLEQYGLEKKKEEKAA